MVLYICLIYVLLMMNTDLLTGIRSEAASRFSGEPETLNATHKTHYRLHITQTKDCKQHRSKTAHNTTKACTQHRLETAHNPD